MKRTEELDVKAKIAAEYAHAFRFPTHRAVVREELVIAFGNDGATQVDGSNAQVDRLLGHLNADEALQNHNYGFGTAANNYSWAIVIEDYGKAINEHELHAVLWDIWDQVRKDCVPTR